MSSDAGHVDYSECEAVLNQLLKVTQTGSGDKACVNMYDIRLRDSYPSCGMNWPPDLEFVEPYLRKLSVVDALHVNPANNQGWEECNGAVGSNFRTRNSKPSINFLPDIIKEVPTLLFSGAEDLICNHIGTEKLIDNMSWNGGKGWKTGDSIAPRRNWTVEGESAGYWQEARNLTYVLFHDSSHMVPFDYPRRSRDMLDRFMGVDFPALSHVRLDSQLDGEKEPDVGTAPDPQKDEKKDDVISEATWAAYRRSGEVVLAIVIVAAAAWGFFVWRDRKRRAAYRAIDPEDSFGQASRFGSHRKQRGPGDLEAAAFDESELDDLHLDTPTRADSSKYALGDDSDDEEAYPSQKRRNEKGESSDASLR